MASNKRGTPANGQNQRMNAAIYKIAHRLSVKKHAFTLANAKRFWQEGCISPGRLPAKIATWKHILKQFRFEEDARSFLEKKISIEASGESYYREHHRKKYCRQLLDLAHHLHSDGNRLNYYDVQLLWNCTDDPVHGPSQIKFQTLSYALNEMKFTARARRYLKEKVADHFDRLSRDAPRKSKTPKRSGRKRRRKSTLRKPCFKRKRLAVTPTSPSSITQLRIPSSYNYESDSVEEFFGNDAGFELDPEDLPEISVGDQKMRKDQIQDDDNLDDNDHNEEGLFVRTIASPLKAMFPSLFSSPMPNQRNRNDLDPPISFENKERKQVLLTKPSPDKSEGKSPNDVRFSDEEEDLGGEKIDKNIALNLDLLSNAKEDMQSEGKVLDLDADMDSEEGSPEIDNATKTDTHPKSEESCLDELLEEANALEKLISQKDIGYGKRINEEQETKSEETTFDLDDVSEIKSWQYELPSNSQCLYCDYSSNSIFTSDNSGSVYHFSFDGRLLQKIEFPNTVISIFNDDEDTYFVDDESNFFVQKDGSLSFAFSLNNFFTRSVSGYRGKFAISTIDGSVVLIDSQGAELWTKITQKDGHGFFVEATADGIYHACGKILCKYDWEGTLVWTYYSQLNILDATLNKEYIFTSDGAKIHRTSGESSLHFQSDGEFNLSSCFAIAQNRDAVYYEHFLLGLLKVSNGKVSQTKLDKRPFHLYCADTDILVAASDYIQVTNLINDSTQTKECKTSDVDFLKVSLH